MKNLIIILLFLMSATVANSQKRWKTIKPIKDTTGISEIVIFVCECTGARDVDMIDGYLKMSDSLVKLVGQQPTMDVSDEQKTWLFGTWDNPTEKMGYVYWVRGKIISVIDRGFKPKAGPRYIPFFDIYQYKLLRKELNPSDGPNDPESSNQ
jgi:hypothetical protein